MKKILQNNRGETIVEVLVSFVLLLMFTVMFVVSLRYARATANKAQTLRDTAYAFCAGLYPDPTKGNPTNWKAVTGKESMSINFLSENKSRVFTVDGVKLESAEVEAKITTDGSDTPTTETHTFHRYSNATTTPPEEENTTP